MKTKSILSVARVALTFSLAGLPTGLLAQSAASAQQPPAVEVAPATTPPGQYPVQPNDSSANRFPPYATSGEYAQYVSQRDNAMAGMAPDLPGGYARPSRPAPALVLSFGQTDEGKQEELEQDLNVMALLLERNLERTFGRMPTIKMGIPMLVRDGSRSLQPLYVEGYGALFLVNVNFPLAGPPEPPKAKEEKPKNTEWEAIKEQLYGDPNDAGARFTQRNYSQAPEFNAERVEAVLDELIRSLKNASNLRGVKPDEFVAVSVEGTGQAVWRTPGAGTVGMGGGYRVGRDRSGDGTLGGDARGG